MARLTEEMVIARSKQSDLAAIKKLNCWGAELGDVSLLRRMPNVEVLAFSINKIRTLDDFACCRRLRELYIRKNEIRDLAEIRHLRRLPDLTSLWLDENPCTRHPEYRMTVLKNLPNLEKLDNVPVQPDEVQEAARRGAHIPDSDDEGYPQQESFGQYRSSRSCDSSPDRDADAHYYAPRAPPPARTQRVGSPGPAAPSRRVASGPVARSPDADADERYEHPAMTRSYYDSRAPDPASLPRSYSAHSVKEHSYSTNGECRFAPGGGGGGVASPPPHHHHYHEPYYDRAESSSVRVECEQDRASARERERERDGRSGEYPSAVMGDHRGFTRRPVTRNSNLLSAVLCLVKELDYPSLEVAEMAVRCRMDELANGQ